VEISGFEGLVGWGLVFVDLVLGFVVVVVIVLVLFGLGLGLAEAVLLGGCLDVLFI
jgi:uncharacterized membrane protein